jgi:phage shock protein A
MHIKRLVEHCQDLQIDLDAAGRHITQLEVENARLKRGYAQSQRTISQLQAEARLTAEQAMDNFYAQRDRMQVPFINYATGA